MLPIFEETEEIVEDEPDLRLSIFKTIMPTIETSATVGSHASPNFSLSGLKSSVI